MGKSSSIRNNFLRSFTASLIRNMITSGMINTYPDIEQIKKNIKIYEKPESTLANVIIMNQNPEVTKLMQPFDSLKEVKEKETQVRSLMNSQSNMEMISMPGANRQPMRRPQQMRVMPPRPIMQMKPMAPRTIPSSMPPKTIQLQGGVTMSPPPATMEKLDILGLAKFDKILSDPGVQTIECPGPNKQILVYKNGAISAANMSLTGDEISNIMNEVSEKTKIPLMSGIFKAAHGNIIITAVMSEFVGTRFIIQKKGAQTAPQPTSLYQ